VVGHLSHHSKVQGSSPADAAGTGRDNEKKFKEIYEEVLKESTSGKCFLSQLETTKAAWINEIAHFKKCKQLFEYQHLLLLGDIW
jgi:hypothetical protein